MSAEYVWGAECAAPHPGHTSGQCERRPGDAIHGPWEECEDREGSPCINHDAHHDFAPAGPEAWGAIPDGVTDCTEAIQAWVDYMVEQGGGALDPGPGTWVISKMKA